jgi:SAM-dependent methyltransferase
VTNVKVTAREVLRHLLRRTGLGPALNAWRARRRGTATTHLDDPDLARRFDHIYQFGIWTHGNSAVPLSGEGSSLAATDSVRSALPSLLRTLDARSLLDLGCGDFTWMLHVPLEQSYIGVDIVESVVRENQRRYASAGRTFVRLDATREPLPAADVVLCREVLFHLSLSDCFAVLGRIRESGARYLIATTDDGTLFNADIASGDFRILNLRARPFRFGAPMMALADAANSKTRQLAVWEIRSLPRAGQP